VSDLGKLDRASFVVTVSGVKLRVTVEVDS
jgi:hypothetical protein